MAIDATDDNDAPCATIVDDPPPDSRDAALARLQQVEHDVVLARQERDVADAHIQAALARAVHEHTTIAPTLAVAATTIPVKDLPLLYALLHHEVAALLNLHAQAVAIHNICSLVPLVLDINSIFFAR
ncbi:hypothetical protein GUJ93_ZPchr0007g6078 [Zizania palustris]|uniref:Uncharacterized protein n=1 Tax=Zizania palustris TaxID=103762 RepID=A0A8J5VUE0_ZIZPA|nr:hypothetical protein GUJ93_ZPchr0007g6078 [Zizania palustris]